jgi:5-formyltetrahydrofolate cyclo-ligase
VPAAERIEARDPLAGLKEALRRRVHQRLLTLGVTEDAYGSIPGFVGEGRAAERLRRTPEYRGAQVIFCAPDRSLLQVRINALHDGKSLIVATPGLRGGFVLLERGRLPFHRLAQVVSARGFQRHGRPLRLVGERFEVDLLVTGALAVDDHGRRLGKGAGFFDLECALLAQAGWLSDRSIAAALVHEEQVVEAAPAGAHDVAVQLIVTPESLRRTGAALLPIPGLLPDRLDDRRRHLPPVRELLGRGRRRPGPRGSRGRGAGG